MEIWSHYIHYLLLFSIIENGFDAKKICIRKSYTIKNGSFFQRIEMSSSLRCAERCVDNIQHCKAALFTFEGNKNRSFCQLYKSNSNSSDKSIAIHASSKSTSTVFEILDQCLEANNRTNSGSDLTKMIQSDLKQKLESWSDPEPSYLQMQQVVQHFKNNESTRNRTIGSLRQPINGLTSLNQNRFNSSPSSVIVNKRSQQTNHYSLLQTSNNNKSYLSKQNYSLPTTGVLHSTPIKPVSVSHGGQGTVYAECHGTNCYAPSLAYLQKSGHNQLCPVYSPPCKPKIIDPCFTRCPQGTIASPSSVSESKELSSSYISKQESVNVSKSQDEGTHGPEKTLSTPPSWSEWSQRTPCSVTCGIGTTTRKRFCSVSGQCPGESTQEELCSSDPCPEWQSWTEWTACSRSCGGGERSRSRICSVNQKCDGPSISIEACNVESCAQWSAWGNWASCSVTCGNGEQIRQRQCMGGNECIGESFEKRVCEQNPCPSWSIWASWSLCSASCDKGQRHRTRICHGKDNCDGNSDEYEVCILDSCPFWTDWSSWSQCTETCGTKGSKLRARNCIKDNSISSLCNGAAQDQIPCKNLPECPVWISWSPWSTCSVSCGQGQENRQRSCLPAGANCIGPEREFRFCQESVCPYWDEWSSWSACSVTCGSGVRERRRKCIKEDLIKSITKERFSREDMARKGNSSIHKNQWHTNDQGDTRMMWNNTTQRSNRLLSAVDGNVSVVRIIRDDNSCGGNDIENEQCNAGPCCKLSEWTTWTACSVSCGTGIRERHRTCFPQQNSELNRSTYNSKGTQESAPIQPITVQQGFSSAFPGQYTRPNYAIQGLQPIVMVKRLGSLVRINRQAENVRNFRLSKQDNFVSKTDESLCHCDGELREEKNCAQISCPEMSEPGKCGWSRWAEHCDCTRLCNQGSRIRTRYCVDGILASDDTRRNDGGKDLCILSGCSTEQESQLAMTEQNTVPRIHSTRSNYFPQQKCPIVPTVNRDNGMKCLWSSWSPETSCMRGFKAKTRSCITISAETKCQCDGKLIEQITCLSPQIKMITSNQRINPIIPISSSPMASESFTASKERLIAYRNNTASCSWSSWGTWSVCSQTCGAGNIVRERFCPCGFCGFGKSTEVQFCRLMTC